MTLQEKYWEDMTQIKFRIYYFESYFHETSLIDKFISGFLAVAASASIGGWVVWEDAKFVWATIIAVSQVINVIKTQLPFTQRKKELSELNKKLNVIFDEYDKNWHKIAKGMIDEAELNDLVSMMRTKVTELANETISDSLPQSKRHIREAQARVAEYYSVYGA